MDSGEDLRWCETIFAREEVSRQMLAACTRARVEVMPDLASWYQPASVGPAETETGWFLRDDAAAPEGMGRECKCDPVRWAIDADGYCRTAARYQHVWTNRLHFAIAALLCGRMVTAVPTTWHKMRAYFDQWCYCYRGRLRWQWSL